MQPVLEEVSVLKIRIKFAKIGPVKYVGHLDMLRYFQKLMRRAGIDITYSEGFNPHQKMSFAAPLGVGIVSNGEYFDIEVNSTDSSNEMIKRINEANVEGIEVLKYKLLDDNAKNCMAIIAGADYTALGLNKLLTKDDLVVYLSQPEIVVLKKTKKSEKEIDIKPWIYELKLTGEGLFMKVAQGSASNLKPDLVVSSLFNYLQKDIPSLITYQREEMYCMVDDKLVPLDEIGETIE